MLNSAFNRRRWLGGHRRGAADARQRGNPLRFINHGLVAIWDAALGVTLNGADVSALADQVPWLPLSAPVAYDLSQAIGANQPLYTGAPSYNGQPSIQFTAANTDSLFRANTNLKSTLDVTIVTVHKLTACPNPQGGILCNEPASTLLGVGLAVQQTTNNRAWHDAASAFRTDGVASTAAIEVWIGREVQASTVPTLMVNGVLQAALGGGNQTPTDPGGTASLSIGTFFPGTAHSLDFDFRFACWFQSVIPDGVAVRLSHALGATNGVVA